MERPIRSGRATAATSVHRVVEGESNLSCGPLFAGGTGDAAAWSEPSFFLAGHTAHYSASARSLFLFGGYDGSKRTNDLYVLRNAHSLATEGAESAELAWEKGVTAYTFGRPTEVPLTAVPATLDGVRDRAGHGSFMRDDKLYIHAGYDSKHNVLHDLVEVDVAADAFPARTVEYKSVLPNLERRWHGNFIQGDCYFVHGGWNDSGGLADLIYLDLRTLKWSAPKLKGTVPSFRRWHTITQLAHSSQHLLFGGYNGGKVPLGDAFILNVDTQTWSQPRFKGKMPGPRCRHTMTAIDSKQLVLLGGYKESDDAIYKEMSVLHTDDMSWQQVSARAVGPMLPAIRSGHSATSIEGEGVLVCGGWKPDYIQPAYWIDLRMV